jgi:valyl-tRNA synthetase
MSKSLGTGIDPLNLIEKYGADATRFGLIWQETGSQDIHFGEESIIAGKKFCNKIWNASRFVLTNLEEKTFGDEKIESLKNLTHEDKQILNGLKKTAESMEKNIKNYQFCAALQTIYEFFWHSFCDKYIETAKNQIVSGNQENTKKVLFYTLLNCIKLLHPFMPFVSEEIYQILPYQNKKSSLMIDCWPYAK